MHVEIVKYSCPNAILETGRKAGRWLRPALVALLLCAPLAQAQAKGQAVVISLADVIQQVLSSHPDLAVSRVDAEIAGTKHREVKGQLDPVISASISASEEIIPVASDFQASENRSGQVSGSISKPLPNGGTLAAQFDYNRSNQGFVSPLAAQLAKFNPAYRNQIDVSYRHPLFKGASRPEYYKSIAIANADVKAAQLQQQLIAHNLSLQALNGYYRMASDDINISIAEQAVKRAKRLLSYQRSRERFGLIERADRLQAEALLAARLTDLQQAKARRAESQSSLNRLMLRRSETPLRIAVQNRPAKASPTIRDALAKAKKNRPELKVLQAQLEAAQAALDIVRDSDQVQLDVVAALGSRSLSGKPVVAAAGGLNVNDHFVSLSLEFSDTINRNSARAAIVKADLARDRIAAERVRTIEQFKDDLAAAMTTIRTAGPTLNLIRKQAQAERKKFRAEMRRYKEGRSDTATLVQFEGELRNAELNAQLQQLTLQLARRQLSWAQGSLLHELGITAQAIAKRE
jgi:outer membrane protein TolC